MEIGINNKQSINKALAFSIISGVLAKLANFVQSIVVTYMFGVQKSTDILFYAVSLIFLVASFAGCVNQQILIPSAISIRETDSDSECKGFLSRIYFWYILIGACSTAVLLVFPVGIFTLFSKFSSADIQKDITLLYIVIPVLFFSILNTYLLDVLTAYRYFAINMWFDMGKNILVMLSMFVLKERLALSSLALGILVGNLIQFIALNIIIFKFLGFRNSVDSKIGNFLEKKKILYVISGHFVVFLSGFFAIYLLSGFNAGVYSAMDYSQKIYTIIITIVIGQISTVIGINIMELFAKGDEKNIEAVFTKYLKMSLYIVIPMCFIISVNSERIIYILFKRGEFTIEAVRMTSLFLKYFVLIVPLRLMDSFIARLMIAKQIQSKVFFWQVVSGITQILGVWVAVNLFGFIGYPLGLLIFYGSYVLCFVYCNLKWQFPFIGPKNILRFFIGNYALNLLILTAIEMLSRSFYIKHSLASDFAVVVAVSVLFLSISIALGCLLNFNRELLLQIVQVVNLKIRRYKF